MEHLEVASGLQFPEGPVALADGSVLIVEIQRGTLTRIEPGGAVEVIADCGGGPNGAAIGPDGAVYVTNNGGCFEWRQVGSFTFPGVCPPSYAGGSIQRVDLATGEVVTLYTECDGRRLGAPNDLVFDSAGGFWFTDLGVQRERSADRGGVYYATADGSSIHEVIFPLVAPNGIGLSPGGDRLYVAETTTGRLWAWQVREPGVVSPAPSGPAGGTLVAGLPGYQRLDSLAVEATGNVCVGTLVNGGITVVTPDDGEVEHIPLPDPIVSNICFGGPDLRTAYVTLSGSGRLVSMPWPRPGLRLAF